MILRDLILAVVFLLIISLFLASCEFLRRRLKVDPELSRKAVHIGGCAMAMLLPLFFKTHWPVLVITSVASLGIYLGSRRHLLHALDDVERDSAGGLYHPLAIYVCFVLSSRLGNMIFFEIGMLVLALSDSMAALVGRAYGQRKYLVDNGDRKSLEGSAIFFLLTFLIVHLGLLLFTESGRWECVLSALLIACLVTIFEAISLRGADNFFVPIGTVFILAKNVNPDAGAILHQFAIMVVAFSVMHVIMRPYGKIGFSGYVAFSLAAYTAGGLIQVSWMFAIVYSAFLMCRTRLVMDAPVDQDHKHRVEAISLFCIVPVVWVLVANLTTKLNGLSTGCFFVGPYISSLSAQLTEMRRQTLMTRRHFGTNQNLLIGVISLWLPLALLLVFEKFERVQDVWFTAVLSCFSAIVITWLLKVLVAEKTVSKSGFRNVAVLVSLAVTLLQVLAEIIYFFWWSTNTGEWP